MQPPSAQQRGGSAGLGYGGGGGGGGTNNHNNNGLLFFESTTQIPPPLVHISTGKSQSPPTTTSLGRNKRQRPEAQDQEEVVISQTSLRILTFRDKLVSSDANHGSFDDFEEVLGQELHDEDDWMDLSRPAIEVIMIYAVRAVRSNGDRYQAGVSYLRNLVDLLEYHQAKQTSEKLLSYLSTAYNSKDKQLISIVRRLERIKVHRRVDSKYFDFEESSRTLVFEEEEEQEGQEEQAEQAEHEEPKKATTTSSQACQTVDDTVVPIPITTTTVDVGTQSDEIVVVPSSPAAVAAVPIVETVASQTEFNTYDEENNRLRNEVKHAELLLRLQVA